ncbi:MAG: MFS transporter [Bacteroidetes bacterium]|nr:MFS transporter [Bacteroidota bacterium]MDA1121511.1 MFS transporter [Bacteroidota bacterium]
MIKRIFKSLADIEPNEFKSTILSFLFVFILMASYYILRPVRDAMASDWSDSEVSSLWTLNFFISAAVVALYGFVVSRVKFKILVPSIYAFFAATFIFFYLSSSITDRDLVDKSFYVWISVFSMFHISVFWSFMSDIFNKDQAKRLFAIIAAGASAGALIGPMIPAILTGIIGTEILMLIAAFLLIVPVPIIFYLAKLKTTELHNEDVKADLSAIKIGGNPFAGFRLFLTDPYLLAIGVFILLYTMIGSFVYFEQKNLLEVYDRATRTQILGSIDWLVNVLTFGIAFFATGRIVKKFGVGLTLASMPILVCAGMLILAFAPIITVLLALQVIRRAGSYAVTRPAREMLFTEVDKETRFKAKPVIDVVVYRGGDTITAWFFTGLTEGLGLGFAAVGIIGAVIAAIWAGVGIFMGKFYDKKSSTVEFE